MAIFESNDKEIPGFITCEKLPGAPVKVKRHFCLDSFLEASVMRKVDSPCFECPQGKKEREKFARTNAPQNVPEVLIKMVIKTDKPTRRRYVKGEPK